jgi:hypothetical protein
MSKSIKNKYITTQLKNNRYSIVTKNPKNNNKINQIT